MLGDARLSQVMADALLEEGIYVIGFFYPVVPKGQARIRVQLAPPTPARTSIRRSMPSKKWGRPRGCRHRPGGREGPDCRTRPGGYTGQPRLPLQGVGCSCRGFGALPHPGWRRHVQLRPRRTVEVWDGSPLTAMQPPTPTSRPCWESNCCTRCPFTNTFPTRNTRRSGTLRPHTFGGFHRSNEHNTDPLSVASTAAGGSTFPSCSIVGGPDSMPNTDFPSNPGPPKPPSTLGTFLSTVAAQLPDMTSALDHSISVPTEEKSSPSSPEVLPFLPTSLTFRQMDAARRP